jgi:hypothetical protein
MAKREPILAFRLSHPESFHCSLCEPDNDEGTFIITGEVSDLLVAFKMHVERFHPAGEKARADGTADD